MTDDFKYDIAFSFLKKDQHLVKDYLGRTTYREVITTKTQFYHVQLNQKFTTGTYFLYVFNESEQFIQKIIKLN